MESYQNNQDFSYQLSSILSKEIIIYNELLEKEKEKSKAIHTKNTKELLEISQNQEFIFPKLEGYEKEREEILYSRAKSWSKEIPNSISELLEWKEWNDEEAKENLRNKSNELKNVIIDLNKLTTVNQETLTVNNEWFHTMIDTMTSDNEVSYPETISNQTMMPSAQKPLFINTSC